ncbi:MAG: hypothetical protein JNK90_15765 [Planctomycetaceae bacterium]|nr:hypothetical protein [Planctomycetaceae bacterium]
MNIAKASSFLLLMIACMFGCRPTVEGRGVIGTVPRGSVLYDEDGTERPNLDGTVEPPAEKTSGQSDAP